jgi:hypothetical protein
VRGSLAASDLTGGDAQIDALIEQGLVEHAQGRLVLTSRGRVADAIWAELTPGEARDAAESAYGAFGSLNERLLRACHDWQVMRGGVPNDHSDPAYDARVVDRLRGIDRSVQAMLVDLTKCVPRFGTYAARFTDALQRVDNGDREWFASPACDSYHTVWMQLHEDLLLATGRDRADESA